MPTATGGETIGERLTRLRAELVVLRAAHTRALKNGSSFSMGGVAVSSHAIESYRAQERALTSKIARLEARLSGTCDATNIANTVIGT